MDWNGLLRERIELKLPLLIVKARNGVLACGYLNIATFDKTGEAAAIVTGVKDFEGMLSAKIVAVSEKAKSLGVTAGQSGAEALSKMR